MIVATTLAGPGAEATIGDALRSAREVADRFLIIHSGDDEEATELAALEAVPDQFIFDRFDWTGSYADARNHALRLAEQVEGATWALTLDTDERLELDRAVLPLHLPDVHSINIKDRDHGYQKERLIRCGVGAQWQWPVHERLVTTGRYALAPGAFWELEKTPAQKRARMLRGIEACEELIASGDTSAHLRRHFAECLGTAGRLEEAVEQWTLVAADPEAKLYEKTWSEFRLAEQDMLAGRYAEARDRAATALGRDPGLIQELGTLLACLNSYLGDHQAALLWAMTVLGAPVDETRGGHRFLMPSLDGSREIVNELSQEAAGYGVRGCRPAGVN